jgi:hypothetical protein
MSQIGIDKRSFASAEGGISGPTGRVFHTPAFANKRF